MRTAWWWPLALVGAACNANDPSAASAVAHDPCALLTLRATGATADEQAGIAGAVALWRGRGVTAFAATTDLTAPDPTAPVIDIQFQSAADTFHGLYVPEDARVLINRDLTAAADLPALSIVVAHELGHVFGLVHIDPAVRVSLMNAGNLTSPPTDADQAALQAIWGTCPPIATPP